MATDDDFADMPELEGITGYMPIPAHEAPIRLTFTDEQGNIIAFPNTVYYIVLIELHNLFL